MHKTDIERLLDIADRLPCGDTGAFDDLMQSKQDDLAAQDAKDQARPEHSPPAPLTP